MVVKISIVVKSPSLKISQYDWLVSPENEFGSLLGIVLLSRKSPLWSLPLCLLWKSPWTLEVSLDSGSLSGTAVSTTGLCILDTICCVNHWPVYTGHYLRVREIFS